MTTKLASLLVGVVLACALSYPAFATQRTGACGNTFLAPTASSLALSTTDDGTLISPANATGPADGWAAASLPTSLPSVASLSGNPWTICGTSDGNKAVIFLAPLLAVPTTPVLSQTAGGSLGARTYFAKVTYTNITGETTVSAEATLAVGANNRLVVAGPASSGNATGWNLYVSTATNTETLQNVSPMVLGVNFTEPLGGLVSGVSPPSTNTASSAYILDGGRVLNRYLVGGTNYQTATLSSDGANYRVVNASDETRMIAGATTGFPARYGFPGGPGYQATEGDNGTAITSGATSGGLTVTLPSITTIATGWTVRFDRDASQNMTVNTNGTNGGAISFPGGSTTSVKFAPYNGESITLQYDGAVFRMLYVTTATATAIGVSGVLGHVPTLAVLKLTKGTPDSAVLRDGFLAAGDGGATKYNWSATNCASADNGAQVQPTAVTGCWIADFSFIPANIMQWGAVPDGSTDSAAAIQAAIDSGVQKVIVPSGTFRSSAALLMSGGNKTLIGAEYYSSVFPPTGSVIQCDATITTACLQVGNNDNLPYRVEKLTISRGAGVVPGGGGCLTVQGAQNTVIIDVECYNHAQGMKAAISGGDGIYLWFVRTTVCKFSDYAYIVDSMPGVYFDHPQAGCNGSEDVPANGYVKITGDWTNTKGTVHFIEPHFNLGVAAALTCAVRFSSFTGSVHQMYDFQIIGGHEEVAQNFLCSDSSVEGLVFLAISGHWAHGGWGGTNQLFNLDAATKPYQWAMTGDTYTAWTAAALAPTNGIDDLRISDTAFGGTPISIHGNGTGTTIALTGNSYNGVTLSGTFGGSTNGLGSIVSGVARLGGGSYSYAADMGPLEIDIPGFSLAPCSARLAFPSGTGLTGSESCVWQLHGSQVHLSYSAALSALGTASGAAQLSFLPLQVNASSSGASLCSYANMAGLGTAPLEIVPRFTSTTAVFAKPGNTDNVAITEANFTNTSAISCDIVYTIPQ